MAAFVFARETETWLAAARAAAPSSAPQLAFVLLVLAIGVATGRVSRRLGADATEERVFSEGGGI